ncbi:hypothetical protein [Pseudacidovorax sp. RU35E]|uniref:hypothetical protein n=1 Tax=Pseudacidovorax sp. RU35E TaxID=1907403 RepID=UPI00095511D3|nr:hypothetical protein [Pseudacidovorax sp. RU35E]SIR68208.1 hypothetical protein SAMN05880557_11684 [Pseudacidovorax sp. RU35E]
MSTYKSILEPAILRYAKPPAFPLAAFCEQIINIGLFFDGTDSGLGPRKDVHKRSPAKTWLPPSTVVCTEAA